jgi:hypothetical protein
VSQFAIASIIHLSDRKRETRPMFRSRGDNIWDQEMPIRFGGIPLWLSHDGDPPDERWPCRPFAHEISTFASQEEFQKLGPIVAIIAPSWWHDLYLREYLSAYPTRGSMERERS